MNVITISRRVLLLAITSCTLACCPPIRPSTDEVRTWVTDELPAGTPEADVIRFCEAHGFGYPSLRDPDSTYVQVVRRAGGCDSTKPIIMIEIRYDESRRVKSTQVSGASMLP